MHVHHPGLISISAGFLAALAGDRSGSTSTRSITPDTLVSWTGDPPADEDARLVWVAVTARAPARYADVIEETAERLFRRDLARLGMTADIGFFLPLYRAYAREVARRLEDTHLGVEDGR
jgi:hypothetical protein